ncbi:MAG: YwaF family protein [Myxococcales bacterium]
MKFFEPHTGTSELFRMGGPGHLALVVLAFALVVVMVALRQELWRLRRSRAFMAGTAAFVLASEAVSSGLQFVYPFPHAWERLPLHLCASLKIAVAVLILFERYDLVKLISTWSIGAGFISFANLNLNGESFGNFMFWHYLWGHLYLLAAPVLLFLVGEYRYDHRTHARSLAGLFLWSLVVFFANWAFDANWMYTGPHNDTVVPFVPARFMVWPFNYVSYVVTALVLLNLVYVILWSCQGAKERGGAETELDPVGSEAMAVPPEAWDRLRRWRFDPLWNRGTASASTATDKRHPTALLVWPTSGEQGWPTSAKRCRPPCENSVGDDRYAAWQQRSLSCVLTRATSPGATTSGTTHSADHSPRRGRHHHFPSVNYLSPSATTRSPHPGLPRLLLILLCQ